MRFRGQRILRLWGMERSASLQRGCRVRAGVGLIVIEGFFGQQVTRLAGASGQVSGARDARVGQTWNTIYTGVKC